jgi:hypothetical protein
MRDYDELEDYQDDFEEWAAVYDRIHRDVKKQFIEDRKSVDLMPRDLADLAQEWDDLLEQSANPHKKNL